jgi:hypothetical protein
MEFCWLKFHRILIFKFLKCHDRNERIFSLRKHSGHTKPESLAEPILFYLRPVLGKESSLMNGGYSFLRQVRFKAIHRNLIVT